MISKQASGRTWRRVSPERRRQTEPHMLEVRWRAIRHVGARLRANRPQGTSYMWKVAYTCKRLLAADYCLST